MIFDRAITRMRNEAVLRIDSPEGWDLGLTTVSAQSTAMKVSAVNACVEVLTNSMSKLPVFIMDNRTKQRISGHSLLHLLDERPNEAMTPSVHKKLIEANRLMKGNGYDLIVRSKHNARPVELIPLPPDYVKPWIDEDGRLWYLFTHPRTGDKRKLDQWDVLHYKAYSEDGISGISVLTRAGSAISTAWAAQQYENKLYTKNASPPGVLKVASKMEKEAKDKVREEWERVHSGVDNAFRIAILDLGLEYQPISMKNSDMQFIQSKAVTVEDIARFFGVPLYKLNSGKQSYSSNEQNSIEYVVGTLHPSVTQYEEEQTYKLLFDTEIRKGLEVRINMMAELRGDFNTRAGWYKTMREVGAFSADDILALEDMPGVPGGSERLASLNYVPLDLWRELSITRARNGQGGEV